MATILVIDNDLERQASLERQLSAHGHRVLIASDGEKGLEIAVAGKPQIVIIDSMTPKVHGQAVVETMRAVTALSHTKIIVCSVKGYATDVQVNRRAGADLYIKQPVQIEELEYRIAELMAPGNIQA